MLSLFQISTIFVIYISREYKKEASLQYHAKTYDSLNIRNITWLQPDQLHHCAEFVSISSPPSLLSFEFFCRILPAL